MLAFEWAWKSSPRNLDSVGGCLWGISKRDLHKNSNVRGFQGRNLNVRGFPDTSDKRPKA